MKFYFRQFVIGLLLFAGGNLSLAQGMTVDEFNSIWENEGDNTYYSGGVIGWTGSPMRGCVTGARQSAGSFSGEGDVEIRKLVRPTSTPGIFDVNILLRGKRVTQIRTGVNVCSVVLFDVSGSMKDCKEGQMQENGVCKSGEYADTLEKWNSAISGAVEFSKVMVEGNDNARVGLVLFGLSATVKRNILHDFLDVSLFGSPGGNTNLHDGLIKAGNLLDGVTGCEAKYIVVMSDGVPTHYMSGGTTQSTSSPFTAAKEAAKGKADELKSQGVQIYSIGYQIPENVKDTLQYIASSGDYYYDASGANISEIFQSIGTEQVQVNAGTPTSLEDDLGEYVLAVGDNSISVSGSEISDPGSVYSFQIKIDPLITGWQASNSGLKLEYTDVSGDNKTLGIDSDHTSEIYWTAPKCQGSHPGGTSVVVGSDEFTQTWSGTVLVPETKEWTYTSSPTTGECEWTCNDANYGGNTNTNTCELKVIVNFDANGGTGDIPPQTVVSGMNAEDPGVEPTRTGYHFTGWTLGDEKFVLPGTVTRNITLVAAWEPNTYTIVFDGNGADAGTMDGLQVSYDQEKNLTKNSFSKEKSRFVGWNTLPDGKGTRYTDEQLIKNLATEGDVEIKLYAQWERLGSSGGGGGGGGGGGCVKDNCPDGDYSGDPCDGKCGNPPKIESDPEPEPTPVPESLPVISNKKCSIEGSKHSAEVNEAYVWACERGIIESNTIQDAKLGEFLNRAEMAKITSIFETSELNSIPNRNKDCSAFAASISEYNQEMKNYMIMSCQLERMGIHTADHNPISDFMPKKFVSRAEFGTILSRILWGNRYEAEKNSRYYYVQHLNKLKDNGILTNIDPTLVERRSYAILMIYRAAKMMGKI